MQSKTFYHTFGFSKFKPILPLLIPIFILPILLYWNLSHKIILENDGIIQIWLGKILVDSGKYVGYGSDHWPFLTPLLLGLASQLVNPFVFGKIISLTAVLIAIYSIYFVCFYLTGDRKSALVCQAFAATNGLLIAMSYYVDNHALDTSFVMISFAILFKIISKKSNSTKDFFALGIFIGLALVTRTNSIILLFVVILLLVFIRRLNFKLIFLMMSPIILLQVISMTLTFYSKGSLFPSSAYVFTLAHEIDPVLKTDPLGWFIATEKHSSLFQIIKSKPSELLTHFLTNFILVSKHVFIISGELKYILVLGFLFGFFQRNLLPWLTIYLFYIGNIALISIFFFNIEFLLHFTLLNAVFIALFFKISFQKFEKRFKFIYFTLLLFLILLNFRSTSSMTKYFAERNSEEVPNLIETVNFLKSTDPNINQKFIMSKHPGYSYYAGSKYLPSLSNFYQCDLAKAVSYEGIQKRYLKYFSIHPAIENIDESQQIQADYLIYTKDSKEDSCGYFNETKNGKLIENYKLIYKHRNMLVFKLDQESIALPGK